MQVSDQNIKYNINQLKQEITNLRNDLQKLGSAEAYEAEKKRLLMVKATIKYLKKYERITAVRKSDNMKQLTGGSEKSGNQEKKDNTKLSTPIIICMALCVITGVLIMGSLIEVNGYDISFLRLLDGVGNLTVLSGSSTGTGVMSLLGFLCFLQWACAAVYFYAVFKFYRRKDSAPIYLAAALVISIFLILWIISNSFNSSMVDDGWGYSLIRAELTGQAWISLLTACGAAIAYYNSRTVDYRLGINPEERDGIIKEIPVSNYYPWENIRFINLVLEKTDHTSLHLVYRLADGIRERGQRNGWEKDITVKTDIIFRAHGEKYILSDNMFYLDWKNVSGNSQKMTLDELPFSINEIDKIEVIIKTTEAPNGVKRELSKVYAVSGMNSAELARYRSESGVPEAVCRKEKTAEEWLCTCGLVNDRPNALCANCGLGQ